MAFTSAMERNKPEDAIVSDVGAAWSAMRPKWSLTESLMGGTEALRAAGVRYLPRYPEEDEENYRARLHRSVLTNFFKKSLRMLSAKPFMKPLGVRDLNPDLNPLLADADKEGNSLHIFAHRGFRAGLGKGLAHILVDYPRDAPRTLAAQRAARIGPYFRLIAPENLIAAYSDIIDGEEQYTHARIWMQSTQRASSFGEVTVEEILVLEPGVNQLWRLVDAEREKWQMIDEWETGIDFVPLVTYYSDRIGFLEADPPLLDVAFLNIAHWQSASDQCNVLTVARFPILGASGVTSINQSDSPYPTTHRIGPHQVLTANDPQSRFYYVEHSGAAIAAGEKDLDRLMDSMSELSMDLVLRGQSGRITATAHAIDKAEADTALSQMAVDYEEALNQALRYAAAWRDGSDARFESAGSVQLASDFGLSLRDVQEVRDLMDARTSGFITHDSLLRELKRRAVLSDDFDVALELQALAGETGTLSNDQESGESDTLRAVQ